MDLLLSVGLSRRFDLSICKRRRVAFGKDKAESASYMRLLLERTGKGYDVQRSAISRHSERPTCEVREYGPAAAAVTSPDVV
ncbi:MAG: hypothetical protein LC808_38755 [Actinobacteria bacterium]|nr:hypothetical protein [Actinomycetota bacterium]